MIKNFLQRISQYPSNQNRLAKEILWGHVYRDSIRGNAWLESLPLNIGRWAGGYAFFYVLNRILNDYQPKKILDLGLGESSKFVSTYLQNALLDSHHTIVEHAEDWKIAFENRFELSDRSKVIVCPMIKTTVNGFDSNQYQGLRQHVESNDYDLILVDGPIGTPRFSRYDMVEIAESLEEKQDFIFMIDDHERPGEKESAAELACVLRRQGRSIHQYEYVGASNLMVIATQRYRHVISL